MVLDQKRKEVQEALISPRKQPPKPILLLTSGEVGREEEHPQIAILLQSIGKLSKLLPQQVEQPMLTRNLEQRATIDTSKLLHQFCTAPEEREEKSSSPSASSTSRR